MNFRFAFGSCPCAYNGLFIFRLILFLVNTGKRNVALFSVLPTYLAFNLVASHTRRSLANDSSIVRMHYSADRRQTWLV